MTLFVMSWATFAMAQVSPQEEFFEQRIRPLLVQHCGECHGAAKHQGGIRLDTRGGVFQNPDIGPLVVAGNPDGSRLWQVLKYLPEDTQMPPDGKLSDTDLGLIRQWIEAGAVWPQEANNAANGPMTTLPRHEDGTVDFVKAAEQHWSYRPVSDPEPPQVPEGTPVRNEIDRFVGAHLAGKELTFSPEADRRTLIRRLKFDLHGLPPTYEEVLAFEQDQDPQAYEHLVERLLQAPEYGQRWARHWLDVARYGDTKGYVFTENRFYPNSFTYRDYVVDAFNADKPYDRFIMEQLAADQLGLSEHDPGLAAMGFLTAGPRFLNREPDIIDDRIDLVSRGLMAMTVGCARCHDHKYDPVPTQDYYSLYGVFESSYEPELPPLVGEVDESSPEYQTFNAELKKREGELAEYCDKAHIDMIEQLKRHVGDYLQAVLVMEKKLPEGLAPEYEHGEPRSRSTRRWRDYVLQKAGGKDRIFSLLATLSALPPEDFASKAAESIQAAIQSDSINIRLGQALQSGAPQNVRDVAKIYGKVLEEVQREWDVVLQEDGNKAAFDDPVNEELRRTILGPGSLTDMPGGEGSALFERDHGNKIRELRKKIQEWLVNADHAPPRAMVMLDKERPTEPVVFIRGNIGRRGDKVPRRGPQILNPDPAAQFKSGSGRLELARQIASADNPLTARVMVNRVWLHHFGVGIVNTPSDFGTRGSTPTHPELLDHLAYRFSHDLGWSLKSLHREILLSHTYRQASLDRPDSRKVDPENELYWRQNRQRLDFEAMRDSMLEVAGTLEHNLGGRPVNLEAEPFSHRRSIYGLIDRNNLSGLLRTFDFPSPDSSSPQRPETTVPQQALFALNAKFVQEQASGLAQRVQAKSSDPREQVSWAFRLAYSRDPSPEELTLGTTYLQSSPQGMPELAQALLMSNEFFFAD